MKTAFIFPGQGTQIVGMARDFYEQFPASKAIFDLSSETVGFDMADLCFTENDRIDQTEYTQVALLTAELAIMEAVKEQGITPNVAAGQSLGEYTALVAAGFMKPQDAIKTVRTRGILMQNAVTNGKGAMVAIVGLTSDLVDAYCKKATGIVEISNYNSEKQLVVSGEHESVMQVKQMAEEGGARLAVELKISIPSHSPLMKDAAAELGAVLDKVEILQGNIPYVANVNAEYVSDSFKVKDLLVSQMYKAVRWEQSIYTMRDDNVELFVEIGPGETLSKLNKKIDRSLNSINISVVEDLGKLV